RRFALVVLVMMAVSVTALVRAAQTTSILSLIATAPLSGQAAADKVHLSGPAGDAFAKTWDEEMKGREAVMKEAREAVLALGAPAKLHAVRTKHLQRAMELIYARAQFKTQLGDASKRGAALAAMAKNHTEMAEAVADGLKELRQSVPDEQSAKMLVAFSGRLS